MLKNWDQVFIIENKDKLRRQIFKTFIKKKDINIYGLVNINK